MKKTSKTTLLTLQGLYFLYYFAVAFAAQLFFPSPHSTLTKAVLISFFSAILATFVVWVYGLISQKKKV